MTRHNVVFFGESGAGMSSVINMLAGSEVAPTSTGAMSCTFESRGYWVNIRGSIFHLHDTPGLRQEDEGRFSKDRAIVQLFTLIKRLEDGVSLLVFVMRACNSIRESTFSNWRLFQEVVCRSQVPTVIVITGLEWEADMDDWWFNNKEVFRRYGISPDGIACVTSARGRQRPSGVFAFQGKYDESKLKVEKLIRSTFLQSPWKMDTKWVNQIRGAVGDLVGRCGMSREDAEALVKRLEAVG